MNEKNGGIKGLRDSCRNYLMEKQNRRQDRCDNRCQRRDKGGHTKAVAQGGRDSCQTVLWKRKAITCLKTIDWLLSIFANKQCQICILILL